mmetsp:Transcript_76852/g.89287  ORF Transcript_76852/g.89287 Transcript_76852/m.89287 type:complete len:180 (+) Transcript_76852:42-581(+)
MRSTADDNSQNIGSISKQPNQKSNENEKNFLTNGVDLTTLGLTLSDTGEKIYSTFTNPFSDTPMKRGDPQTFVLPQCYLKPPTTLNKTHLKKFIDETLLYFFYSGNDDTQKLDVIQELYERNWKYHYPSETWFQSQSTKGSESTYKYFNVKKWEMMTVSQLEFAPTEFITLKEFMQVLK